MLGIITIHSRESKLLPMDKAWHFCTLRKAANTRLTHQCHVCIKAGSKWFNAKRIKKERTLISAGWIPIIHQTEMSGCVGARVCYTISHDIANYLLRPCAANPPFCWHECATSLVDLERLCGRLCDLAVNPPHFLPCKPTDSHILVVCSLRMQFEFDGFIFSFQPLGKTLDSLDIFEGASLIASAYTFHVFSHWPVRPGASLPQRSWSPPAGRPPAPSKVQFGELRDCRIKGICFCVHIIYYICIHRSIHVSVCVCAVWVCAVCVCVPHIVSAAI